MCAQAPTSTSNASSVSNFDEVDGSCYPAAICADGDGVSVFFAEPSFGVCFCKDKKAAVKQAQRQLAMGLQAYFTRKLPAPAPQPKAEAEVEKQMREELGQEGIVVMEMIQVPVCQSALGGDSDEDT